MMRERNTTIRYAECPDCGSNYRLATPELAGGMFHCSCPVEFELATADVLVEWNETVSVDAEGFLVVIEHETCYWHDAPECDDPECVADAEPVGPAL